MNKRSFDEALQQALQELRNVNDSGELCDFEHQVWSEIANRDLGSRSSRLANLFSARAVSIPFTACCAGLSVLIGAWAAMVQATAYDTQTTQLLEQKYVESIHPVLMSASLSEAIR